MVDSGSDDLRRTSASDQARPIQKTSLPLLAVLVFCYTHLLSFLLVRSAQHLPHSTILGARRPCCDAFCFFAVPEPERVPHALHHHHRRARHGHRPSGADRALLNIGPVPVFSAHKKLPPGVRLGRPEINIQFFLFVLSRGRCRFGAVGTGTRFPAICFVYNTAG